MLGKIPIPKGPILNWVKNEYQGDGHETKQTVMQETAALANKILALVFLVINPVCKARQRTLTDGKHIRTVSTRWSLTSMSTVSNCS